MPIDNSQFERIMGRLTDGLPGLSDELVQEFQLGRAVSKQDLRQESGYQERVRRLAESDLPPLAASDVAMVPYSNDERIDLIRDALLTLAETMLASRRAVLKTATERDMEPMVQFGDPELERPAYIDLVDETERAQSARDVVRALFTDKITGTVEASDEQN
ncbi:hypothetical protein AB0N05_13810 [Nocardia sp. NPDC051030]|uniref:hypothetical protein n=1 Tax=Nocardia sp. NPDC051030 TaxID=3155162 RepID=UPI00341C8E78